MAVRVLLVDVDPLLHDALRLCLACEQLDADFCGGSELSRALATGTPLIVLDQQAPIIGVPPLFRQIRQHAHGRGALVLLLVPRTQESPAIDLLNDGIDAFMVKPFGLREFVARVRALLRRRQRAAPVQGRVAGGLATTEAAPLRAADLEIDLARRTVRRGPALAAMTEQEFQLLYYLACHRGRVFTREALVHSVWGERTHVSPRSVDALVKRLRQRLGGSHRTTRYVQTVRGVGYRFVDIDGPQRWSEGADGTGADTVSSRAATQLSPTDH
jgi:DNA-binding response OmpR family regulator